MWRTVVEVHKKGKKPVRRSQEIPKLVLVLTVNLTGFRITWNRTQITPMSHYLA